MMISLNSHKLQEGENSTIKLLRDPGGCSRDPGGALPRPRRDAGANAHNINEKRSGSSHSSFI